MTEAQQIAAGSLVASHIGRLVEVVTDEGVITGRLDGIRVGGLYGHEEVGIDVYLRGVTPTHHSGDRLRKSGFRVHPKGLVTIHQEAAA